MDDLAEARQCGIELDADELVERQWVMFTEENLDKTYIRFIGDWGQELADKGYQILDKPEEWLIFCDECLEIEEHVGQFLGEYLKHGFDEYKDGWIR